MKEIENLITELVRLSDSMTESANSRRGITNAQIKKQDKIVSKLSSLLDLDKDYLLDKLNN